MLRSFNNDVCHSVRNWVGGGKLKDIYVCVTFYSPWDWEYFYIEKRSSYDLLLKLRDWNCVSQKALNIYDVPELIFCSMSYKLCVVHSIKTFGFTWTVLYCILFYYYKYSIPQILYSYSHKISDDILKWNTEKYSILEQTNRLITMKIKRYNVQTGAVKNNFWYLHKILL